MNLKQILENNNLIELNKIVSEKLDFIISKKLDEMKFNIASNLLVSEETDSDSLDEDRRFRGIDLGRERIVQYRFRRGQFQPQAKRSITPDGGFAVRHSDVERMSPTERQKRRLMARMNRYKIRKHIQRILQKRRISNLRRKGMGL